MAVEKIKLDPKDMERSVALVEELAPPVEFKAPPPPQVPPPTQAQHDWLRNNPRYIRTSHAYHRFVERGTLHPDGTFVPVSKHPVVDGNGAFGVGIPLR